MNLPNYPPTGEPDAGNSSVRFGKRRFTPCLSHQPGRSARHSSYSPLPDGLLPSYFNLPRSAGPWTWRHVSSEAPDIYAMQQLPVCRKSRVPKERAVLLPCLGAGCSRQPAANKATNRHKRRVFKISTPALPALRRWSCFPHPIQAARSNMTIERQNPSLPSAKIGATRIGPATIAFARRLRGPASDRQLRRLMSEG